MRANLPRDTRVEVWMCILKAVSARMFITVAVNRAASGAHGRNRECNPTAKPRRSRLGYSSTFQHDRYA